MSHYQSDSLSLFEKIKLNIFSNFYQNTTFLLCEKRKNSSNSMDFPNYVNLTEEKVNFYKSLQEKIKTIILNDFEKNNQNPNSLNIQLRSLNPNTYNPYQAAYLGQSIYHLLSQEKMSEMKDFFLLALDEVCENLGLKLINHSGEDEVIEVKENEVLFKSISHHDIEESLGLEGNNKIRNLAYQNRYQKTLYLIENMGELSPLNQKLTQNLFDHLDLLVNNNNFLTSLNTYYISNVPVPKYLLGSQKVYQVNDLHFFIKRKMTTISKQCQVVEKMSTLRLIINNTN